MGLFDREPEEDGTQSTAQSGSMWGSLATAVSSIYQTSVVNLNKDAREANVAIAEANARAAEATATTQKAQSFDPKYIIIGVIVLVLIIGIMMKVKSK